MTVIVYAKKKCSKCSQLKERTEFAKCKTFKDGLQTFCKACYKTYAEANKEHISKKAKEWREKNPNGWKEWYAKKVVSAQKQNPFNIQKPEYEIKKLL